MEKRPSSISQTDDLANNSNPTSPTELLKRFHALQEERVQTYQLFEEGFKAYLSGSPNYNFPLYRQLVHEITQTFNKISQDIIVISDKLKSEHQQSTLADIINKIQDAEKLKLEQTAKLQLTRQNLVDHPTQEEHKAEQDQLKDSLKEQVEKINDLIEEMKYEAEELYRHEDEENIQAER